MTSFCSYQKCPVDTVDLYNFTFYNVAMRIADYLSLARIVFSPVFVCAYFIFAAQNNFLGFCVLIVLLAAAEFTDYLDGYAARKLKQVSELGKLLDPFCDTLLHLSIFFCFTVTNRMFPIFFILVMYREFAMLFIRMICLKNGIAIAARAGGKIKTVLYIIVSFVTLLIDIYNSSGASFIPDIKVCVLIQTILFVLGLAASYISFVDYLIHFKSALKKID
ncbi:MAG: CDP-diacylglycerol--glycerol-3-phosphate 3-phosphatidyltransferase [Termitinemataceae bacterium]|nr:MAG: CDP-diacylglycerol--glycerol-3-phosphate 3-phosphatidyltransferase [Termitinemataceae bacterium]